MTRFRRLVFGLMLSSLAAFAPALHAATVEYRVFLDDDNSTATGCSVSGMDGVDQVLITRVETGATTATVTGTFRQTCEGGTLGSPSVLSATGWPAGFHAPSGRLLVETRIPFSSFHMASSSDLPRDMRVGVEATRDALTQVALTDRDGSIVLLPEPPHGRRRSVSAPGTPRTFTLDGQDTEWTALDAKFDGIGAGGSFGLRILRVYAFVNTVDDFIYFLFDSTISPDAPFADDDHHKRIPGEPALEIPAPGVLGNDLDSNTPPQPLTARPVSSPLHGTVVVNTDGSFTYTPENPGSRAADVFEYRANNGIKDSNLGRVKIKVGIGADDAFNVAEGTALHIDAPGVLDNDNGGNSEGLTATLLTAPSHGDVTLNPDGGFTYTPSPGFVGDDSFTYTVSGHGPSDTARVVITLNSDDEPGQDNHPPHVLKDKFKVAENSPAGTVVGTVKVTDPNSGDTHTWAILSGNVGNAFAINANTGQITVLTPSAINFETLANYDLLVRATDNGTPPLSDAETIKIEVTNKNDAPQATPQSLITMEGTPIPVTLTGTDEDGDSLTFIVVVNPTHGVLSGTVPNLTYTPNAGFGGIDTFTFRANDGTANSAPATITITVRMVPTITSANSTGFQVGTPSTFTVTTTGYPPPTLSETGALPAGITFVNNGNGTATLGGNAAPGSGGVYVITINATNIVGSDSQTFTITVCNQIVVTNPATSTGTGGSPFSQTFTQTGAVGSATFTTASTLPAGLTLATNGTLSGTPTQTGSFPITVTVTDANGCTGTGGVYTLVIGCPTITVTPPANANGTASSPFSETFTQSGAIGGATFTLASGTLPAGLTLATNGTLSGTPTQTGSFPITVTVTDGNGCTGTSTNYPLVIGCQVITVNNPANANGTASSPFSETFTQSGAIGTATFTLASGTLPAGLTLAANGVLSGTPTQTGSFPITVTATDTNGCTGTSVSYPLNIACQVITVTPPANANGTASSPFSETFTQTGAIGTATFTLASGTLPAGLTLAANGTLSGTPTQTGSFPITVTVTDGNGCTGTSATYTIVIACQTITVTNPANANGTASSPFSETFTQSGAIGTATFTLASGTLPAGLTLATNGVLSGTPTQTGSFPITVTVTDANGCTGTSGTYTIVIACQVITVTPPANANGTASSPFSETFTQTGAIGTANFTLASGTLPAGLTLATNGVLSGTPTQTGSFPITVTVTDSNGCTGTSGIYTIVIACQVITVTPPANANGTASSPFSETFTQTGAIGSATFTLATGTLPAGLTLATNGVLSGTPTQTGSFPITVTVTDANGCTGTSATYTLVIACQVITVTPPANANGTASSPFSETFTQSGAIGTATFTLASGTLPAGLTLATNGVLSGTPTQVGSFPITVTVTDANGCTGTSVTYNLTIGCQTITVTAPGVTTGTVSAAFSQTFTQTGAIGTATFTTASTLPAGLTLSTAGVLSGTPTQNGTFPITVVVTDSNGCTGSTNYTLVIGCQTITVTNPANPNGTISTPFSETFTQSGAVGGATFTTASTLPAGLTLATNGTLSGTPTQTGSFPIVVTVTDGNGCTGTSATYNLVISCQVITVTNPVNATGPAGSPFSETFTQTGAIGTATFTTSSPLPTGLTLAPNGTLSGTPTQGGTFPIVVTVTDSNGCTGTSATYNLTITCPVITVTNPATTTGTAGTAFSQTFTQSGGQGTITFTLASGTLPTGLTLATNGTLSGTPTQTGTFNITVTATDQNGCTGTGPTYALVIGCQTITVSNPGVTTGVAGAPFSQTFTQTGAIGGATFTLNTGTLPAGLTLATNGTLSGTPTQTGSFPITVKVTDGNGCTGISATYTLTITCQTITVTNPATTTGTLGVPFSQNFTQSGAIGTATFTTASTLPAGLTLATNGTLSGTPTQPGSFPIVVTVTDSNGCTGTGATYTLVIACQTITVTNPANSSGTVGTPFSETFLQSGAVGTATFTLNTGSLPAGLTLSTAGVLSGTPMQAGNFPITVKVTDSNGCTGISATYTIVLACQTITVTNPGVTTGTVDAPFSQTFTQTGAIGTATFTINTGTLPSGLTLSTAGVLSGTPGQPGSFPITVKVTDSNGCTGISATYSLVIACQTITVTNPGVTTGTVDAPFSQTFTQSGVGTHTPATFTTSSTLPSGLTLSSAGVLSGTPGQPGTFPITVTVTDANGCTGTSATYTLIIACQTITVTNPGVTTATYNSAFTRNFTQVGVGTHTPATFTTSSTLPTGVTLASNGTLSGTPTQTGTFPIVVTVTDANGCTGTGATYTLAVAPVANNDSFNGAVDNTQFVLTGGTTGTPSTPSVQVAGTIEVNDLPSAATVTVVAGTFATTAGGSVTVAADGTFLYTPPVNSAAPAITSDTFTYTVTSNTGGVAAVTSAPGTVTINLLGRVWYVKNNAAGGGNGQSQSPFNTLASAQTASTANDFIFIYKGDGATTNQNSGFILKNGQQFIGEGVTLTVNGSNLVTGSLANQPLIGNSAGNGVSGTNLSGVVIRGVNVAGSSDGINFITNAANSGGITIADNTVRAAGTQGINIDGGGSGTLTISLHDNTLTATGNAVDIARTAGSVIITAFDDNLVTGTSAAGGIVVTGTGAPVAFDAVPGGGVDTVLGGITLIGSAGAGNGVGTSGMVLNNVSGDLHFADLGIFTDAGTGLFVSGGSVMQVRVNTGGGNTGTIVAIGGPAVDVTATALDLRLVLLTSTNSASTGVNLSNATGTFSAPAGSSISNATGTDFVIATGTIGVTYGGTITDDVGLLVNINGSTGTSTKAFTGAITDGDDGDGSGISLTGNSATTTMRFSGGVVLSTGANAAFTATGGGTVEVCAFNPCGSASAVTNKLTSTTGTTLNVANTTIGANDLTFRSISANGATNGIVLNVTGATGSLIVTGAGTATVGGDASGGIIQNTGGDGVMLTNTAAPSFTNLTIQNTGNSGIKGQLVSDFTFKNGTITGSGGAVFESNLSFNEGRASGSTTVQASGTFTVTNNVLNTAFDCGLEVSQLRGTISQATVTGNSLTSTTSTTTSKGSGIMFNINGDAGGAASVTKALIDNNDVANFPSGAGVKVIGGQGNAAGVNVMLGDPASGTNIITITNNDIHGQSAANRLGTNAIETAVSPKGQGNFDISNNGTVGNPLTNVAGTGIALSCFGNSTVKGVINNNFIVANNIVNSSGMAVGADQGFGVTDAPDLTATITNNNISGAQGNGILAGHKSTNGTVRLTITGNTIAAPTAGSRPGIRVDSGTNLGGDTNVCLDIQNNTTAGSGGFPGIGVRKEGNVATTNDFGIEGLSPSPANPNQTEDDIAASNPGSALGAAGFSNDGLRTVRAIVLSGSNYVSCNTAP